MLARTALKRTCAVTRSVRAARAPPAALVAYLSSSPSSHQSASPSPLHPSAPANAAAQPSFSTSTGTNTISPEEIAFFSSLSAEWWNPKGEFGLLHRMNPARIQCLRDELLKERELPAARWLEGKEVLDVGCGGGIFAESLARLGATTLAIDASGSNITVAQTHASLDPSLHVLNSPIPPAFSSSSSPSSTDGRPRNTLEYRHCAAEDLVKEGKQFDVVCAMEVIEHVEDPRGFLECLGKLLKPGGLLLLSTISRTPLAKLLTITLAEHVLRLVSPGTHTYHKYIKPAELVGFFDEQGWTGAEVRGCPYDPLAGKWRLLNPGELGGVGELVNYFAAVRKPVQ
ncbi:hypothetical protein JCM8097_002534 [Rhodosporidiobolus ruineniae]